MEKVPSNALATELKCIAAVPHWKCGRSCRIYTTSDYEDIDGDPIYINVPRRSKSKFPCVTPVEEDNESDEEELDEATMELEDSAAQEVTEPSTENVDSNEEDRMETCSSTADDEAIGERLKEIMSDRLLKAIDLGTLDELKRRIDGEVQPRRGAGSSSTVTDV